MQSAVGGDGSAELGKVLEDAGRVICRKFGWMEVDVEIRGNRKNWKGVEK
jgi:hypothetical protein